jgi:hypothetical protein
VTPLGPTPTWFVNFPAAWQAGTFIPHSSVDRGQEVFKKKKSVEGAQTWVKSYSDVVLFLQVQSRIGHLFFNQKGVSGFIPL